MRIGIVGAGPAGLACGAVLRQAGLSAVVFEGGSSSSGRVSRISGIGGAGLYSDGKFSYFPSATALWQVERERLARGYDWTAELLRAQGLRPAPLPDEAEAAVESPNNLRARIKKYPSEYLGLNERKTLISSLAEACAVRADTEVSAITRSVEGFLISTADGNVEHVTQIVVATGRLWELFLSEHGMPTMFRRHEYGLRIQQRSDEFIFANPAPLDPKWILRVGSDGAAHEFRTFCCCREGEIISEPTPFGELCSGRADGPKTGKSNVGFLVRYQEPTPVPLLTEGLGRFAVSATEFLDDHDLLAPWFGERVAGHLRFGLELLADSVSTSLHNAELIGPCLEGVGEYLLIDRQSLKIQGCTNAYVAGDASGIFRGLVAALVSGAFVAHSIVDEHRLRQQPPLDDAQVAMPRPLATP